MKPPLPRDSSPASTPPTAAARDRPADSLHLQKPSQKEAAGRKGDCCFSGAIPRLQEQHYRLQSLLCLAGLALDVTGPGSSERGRSPRQFSPLHLDYLAEKHRTKAALPHPSSHPSYRPPPPKGRDQTAAYTSRLEGRPAPPCRYFANSPRPEGHRNAQRGPRSRHAAARGSCPPPQGSSYASHSW